MSEEILVPSGPREIIIAWDGDELLRLPDGEKSVRLLAAAPELLKALESCVSWMPNSHARIKAKAAIAKAKGETS